jgi:hypothetical protein
MDIMEYYSVIKRMKSCYLQEMDETGDHHVMQNEPDSVRQTSHFLSYAESQKENDMKVEGVLLQKKRGERV